MSEYGQESLWRDTATADNERARDLAARLERRAKAEDEVAARDTYLGLLNISAGERVLDVGCGSGAAILTLLVEARVPRIPGKISGGRRTGSTPSPGLLAALGERVWSTSRSFPHRERPQSHRDWTKVY